MYRLNIAEHWKPPALQRGCCASLNVRFSDELLNNQIFMGCGTKLGLQSRIVAKPYLGPAFFVA